MDNYEALEIIGKGSFGSVQKVCTFLCTGAAHCFALQIRRKSDGKILVWKELDYGKMSEKEKHLLVSEVHASAHPSTDRASFVTERPCSYMCHNVVPEAWRLGSR